ncbi:MAG: GTPase Era [bacterium]|nr:GTPase Era [bacterium]
MQKKSLDNFKSGFVSIIGKPNAGKSTLMNALVGERLSIITSKAQTTRHRIFGILTSEDFQLVYSDTPGIIDPQYTLQESMMNFVMESLRDADVILWVVELGEKFDGTEILDRIQKSGIPVILVVNKIDLGKGSQVEDKLNYWKETVNVQDIIGVSALEKTNVDPLFDLILKYTPVHPPYFPKDQLTDKPERFFAAEIVREKIFLNYKKEVPYSCEVVVTEFKEDEKIIRLRAEIYVERKSQKGIIIGKGGAALKKVGIEARKDMEEFFQKQVHLETFVKVEDDWRKKNKQLQKFGYKN